MKNFEGMNLTEEFKNQINMIIKEDVYEYRVIVSSTNKSIYGRHKDDEIIKYHLEHISSDYLEDDNFDTVLCNGYIKDGIVFGEFLFRRKK